MSNNNFTVDKGIKRYYRVKPIEQEIREIKEDIAALYEMAEKMLSTVEMLVFQNKSQSNQSQSSVSATADYDDDGGGEDQELPLKIDNHPSPYL